MERHSRRLRQGDSWGRRIVAAGLAAALGACAISERAEAIYMDQLHAATALIDAIAAAEASDPALADRLYGTENDLDDACAPLREAGYRKMSGQKLDGALERAILGTMDGCAAKTREVVSLLWQVDPETAAYFFPDRELASAGATNFRFPY
jgi:hypothetical protein